MCRHPQVHEPRHMGPAYERECEQPHNEVAFFKESLRRARRWLDKIDEGGVTREIAIARTKLDEAELWVSKRMQDGR